MLFTIASTLNGSSSQTSTIVDVCEEDPFSVDAIVKSMQKKLEAQGNLKKIHEIVKQERRELEEALA
jgi:membrane glycosyltransferase